MVTKLVSSAPTFPASICPKAIQSRLGHPTMTETMDTYGHLFPDAEDHGRGALDTLFSEAAAPHACPERVADQRPRRSGEGQRTSRPVRRGLMWGFRTPSRAVGYGY